MKKIKLIFLFVTVLLWVELQAQPNTFFPTENGVWVEAFIGIAGVPLPVYYATCGDTLINNEEYTKLYLLGVDSMNNVVDQYYQGATLTSADQVQFIPNGNFDSYLLYDFSLVAGQSVELETLFGMNTLTVQDNMLINTMDGITRRMIIFVADPQSGFQEIWIEGIGSNRGVLNRGMPLVFDFDPFMNCFKYEDILIWENTFTNPDCSFSFDGICETTSNDDFIFSQKIKMNVSPNPINDFSIIEIKGLELLEKPELRIYNVQGQLIRKYEELNEEKITFYRKELNAGLYVFELLDSKTTFALRKKVIISN